MNNILAQSRQRHVCRFDIVHSSIQRMSEGRERLQSQLVHFQPQNATSAPTPRDSSVHTPPLQPLATTTKGKQASQIERVTSTLSPLSTHQDSHFTIHQQQIDASIIEPASPQTFTMATSEKPSKEKKDTSKVHKLSLKGSAKLVAEFVCISPCLLSPFPVMHDSGTQSLLSTC